MGPHTEALHEAANRILELWWIDSTRSAEGGIVGEHAKVRVLMHIMENAFADKGMEVRCIPSGERGIGI